MKARHLILMLLEASGGRIESKTKLQKQIYFISLLLDKDLGFKAHYYGPYSVKVEEGLDELIGAGFVDMKRNVFGIDMERGFEVKRYEFYLTESGQKFAKILSEENLSEYRQIQEFINCLKDIGELDYLSLSLAAKAYFILSKENRPMNKEELIRKSREFGWNVSKEDINKAIEILTNLNFVQKG
jgi:uncharacterized protein YwgA